MNRKTVRVIVKMGVKNRSKNGSKKKQYLVYTHNKKEKNTILKNIKNK